VLHITAKTLVVNDDQRPHVKRRYDTASTPFDRLCQANRLPAARQPALEQLRQQTNPRRLHQQVYTLLADVLARPAADSPQDVRETLAALAERVPWPMAACRVPISPYDDDGANPTNIKERRGPQTTSVTLSFDLTRRSESRILKLVERQRRRIGGEVALLHSLEEVLDDRIRAAQEHVGQHSIQIDPAAGKSVERRGH
jgi:hypothetical protein